MNAPDGQVALSATVLGEARELLSALRRNRRFGYLLSFTAQSQPAEHPLVKEVKSVRDFVRVPITGRSAGKLASDVTDGILIPPESLLAALEPFFEVIKSRDASGIITGVALQSLCRISERLIFLADGKGELHNYSAVLGTFVDVAAQCRFDATDPSSDEVVLARITKVLSGIISSPAFPLLSDASILRAVEACLGIASGRRRASELLKRTADAALYEIYSSLGRQIDVFAAHTKTSSTGSVPQIKAQGVNGPAFGFSLDSDAFQQHGPASSAIPVALLELCCVMADPAYASSVAERSLGLQLISALLLTGGEKLRAASDMRQILLRNCCRGVLRSLGLYKSSPSLIACTFTVAIQLVHVLGEDGAPFLLELLDRVYPYYISGFENVLPSTLASIDALSSKDAKAGLVSSKVPVGANLSNGSLDTNAIEIDPVIREIGLESLADLLSKPGLLCIVYRLADCDMKRTDIVRPLLRALGNASKTKRARRRSKRLRASSSGSNRISDVSDPESEEDDSVLSSGNQATESSRFGRASSMLCAESILAVMDTISDRLKLESAGLASPLKMDNQTLLHYRHLRKEKPRLLKAAEIFNLNEKMGKAGKLLALLREHHLAEISTKPHGTVSEDLDEDVSAIVRFIRETPGLNKERIGIILGEPDSFSRRVLADYTATFEFQGRPFTESLRVYLESFRLPGESQKIGRILESFANRYYAQNHADVEQKQNAQSDTEIEKETADSLEGQALVTKNASVISAGTSNASGRAREASEYKVLKSAEAAFVLSYSVVMLNTDQHNESIRKKMSLEDFVRNSRGINDREDFPHWFLAEIFQSIADVEIRMSDEAGIGALTDLLWDEQIKLTGAHNVRIPGPEMSRIFDEEVFHIAWESAIVAANSILNEAGEANAVQKALEGFLSVARCATSFRVRRPTDAVISSLCTATTLRDGPLFGAITRFGTDIKAQMASVALSGVSRQCGDWLQADGWQALVTYLLRLHALCLLPVDLEQHLGTYGDEVSSVGKDGLLDSSFVPAWWPSRTGSKGADDQAEKPKKTQRSNGFFAAILAASIGTDTDSEDDDDAHFHDPNNEGSHPKKASQSIPHYLRMRTREEKEAQDLARKCIASCRIEDVVINEAKVLQSSALEYLAKAIARSAGKILDFSALRGKQVETLGRDSQVDIAEDSIIDWMEIAPLSPDNDSSIIAGVSYGQLGAVAKDSETDFTPLALTPSWEGSIRERDERKAREFVAAFCIDALCELTLQNRDRLHIPWPALHALIVRVVAPATQTSAILERAVVALLRVGVRLLHREELRDDVLRGMNLIVRLPSGTARGLSVPIAAGVHNIVKAHGSAIRSTSGWHAILSILENTARYLPEARAIGLNTIEYILTEHHCSEAVSSETFAPLLDAILAYISSSSVEISIQALELLFILSERLPVITQSNSSVGNVNDRAITESEPRAGEDETWAEFWGPLFLGFASAIRDPRGKVRNAALEILERVVAASGSTEILSASQWSHAFSSVILPLMTKLFSTHGFLAATVEAERAAQKQLFAERNAAVSSNRGKGRHFASPQHDEQLLRSVAAACNRTRMRAVTLTSKTFLLHHMVIAKGLSEDSFTQVWIGVLEVFRVALESCSEIAAELKYWTGEKKTTEVSDLAEHVPESVKNLLLVMGDCGLLSPQQSVRWNATLSIVRELIPNAEETLLVATGNSATKQEVETKADLTEADNQTPDNRSGIKDSVNGTSLESKESDAAVAVASTT